MKTAEILEDLLHEVRYQAREAGRSEAGRSLNILATKIEEAQLWAEHKTESETMLVNPNAVARS